MSFSCELSATKETSAISEKKKQRTLVKTVSASGIGLFTGTSVSITIHPALVGEGIVFQRTDLPHQPKLHAHLAYVTSTPRCTILGDKTVSVQTVEHILAAFRAYGIDNALIEISGPEVPVFDGSSARFVELIEESGIQEQEDSRHVYKIQSPVFWSQGDIHLVALPSNEYRISYTLHYPDSLAIGSQFYSVVVGQEQFKKEIASSRTFSVYEEIAPMIEKGLVKGGSLENAVIIRDNAVINPEGLRFSDEMVRHKILDLIGDLSLMPFLFVGHIIAVRSGHASNYEFAKELFNHIKMENS